MLQKLRNNIIMKKINLLLTALLFCCYVGTAKAHSFYYNKIYYDITDKNSKTVSVTYQGNFDKQYASYSGSCTIPETVDYDGATYRVTSIDYCAFYGCSGLTNVTIPNSVTSIGESAFYGCSGLTSITIPNSVTSIGKEAFYDCSGLTSVIIGNSVTSIGNKAFYGCQDLKTVVNFSTFVFEAHGSNYSYIAYYADKVINVPNGSIERDFVFGKLDGVNTLVTYLGDATKLTLPINYNADNYVIAPNAFENNTTITSIEIPSSITSIGDCAFLDCEGLTAVHISDLSAWCKIDFAGDYSNPLSYANKLYLNNKLVTELVIPNSVTKINNCAFYYCTELTSVTIPNSVTSIGESAFYGCENLKTVNNYSNLTLTKASYDYGCVALYASEVMNFPNASIEGDFVFSTIDRKSYLAKYLGNATHVVLPDKYNGVSYSIGENAFANCSNILSVTIGTNVDAIDANAFSGCNNIAKVFWLPNTPPAGYTALNGKINYVANNKYTNLNNIVVTSNLSSKFEVDGMVFIPTDFANRQCCVVDDLNDNLEDIVVKDTVLYRNVALAVTDVMPYAFYNNDVVKTLTLNNSGIIGEHAFYDNDALTTLTLNNCGDIGASAFYANDALAALTFNNKGSIGASAFEGCRSLSSVNIPQKITSIGDHAFKGCKELTTARIEDRTTVLPLGKRLFDDTALQDLYIGAKISYINEVSQEASPFCENKTLKNVVITDIEDHIYDFEFYNCSALETVTVGDGVESIGNWAFSGCYSLSEFVFGSNVSSIGEEAFSDCSGMTKITGRAVSPPVCGNQALDDIEKWDCTLYVPSRDLSQYQKAEQWKHFVNVTELVTTDKYVTYMIDGDLYKTLLLTPGNRIIAPYVADREDGTPFAGWEMDEYIPSKTGTNGIELKLNESMLYTNAPNTNTAWGEEFKGWTVLLDDNVETFFHSEYGGKQTPDGLDHYIRVDVGENMSIGKFTFTYTTRYNNGSVSPKTMIVEGSNSADREYTEIATLTNLPGDGNTVYTSQELGSDDVRYRYIRYRVTENSGGGLDNGHPFFAMSEFDMQGLLKNEGTVSAIDYPIMPNVDITINGSYTKMTYTLTYMVDGDVYKTFTLNPGAQIPAVENPQKDGFVFSGWSDIPDVMPAENFTITGTFDLEKTGIKDVSEISNNRMYHITQPHYSKGRTSWIVANGGNALQLNSELNVNVQPYDARQQFAIISKDGSTRYLYSVSEKKFVNKDGSLSEKPVDVVLFKSGTYTRTFVIYFDNTHYININENQQLVINANGTANANNSCSIVAVDAFNPTEALNRFNATIPVTGITLNKTRVSLAVGTTITLEATVTPADATDNTVTWTTSDETVATVENGVVTAVALGRATITATAGECSTTCLVVVTNHNNGKLYHIGTNRASWCVETGGDKLAANTTENMNDACQQFAVLSVDGVAYYLYHPASKKFINKDGSLSSAPVDAIYFNYIEDSNTYLAYFDNLSYINIDGNKNILIDYWSYPDDGNCCTFTEVGTFDPTAALRWFGEFVPVSEVTLDMENAAVTEGDSFVLTATVSPADATDQTVEWATSDANVATVDGGVVTAVAPGTAVITATAGSYSATCTVTVTANTVAVSGITLDKATATILEGANLTLNATVSPADATDQTVEWATSEANVATVDGGVVTAVAPGTAVITATAGSYSATCTVTVTANTVAVSGITLDKATATILEGGNLALNATVSPANATDKTVAWATSNANVATVDGGAVTAVAPGTAVITATAGSYSATCTVTVTANTVAVSGITLDKATATILEGGNLALNATVSPANATDKTVAWATSDANVATVYNGVVIAVAPGTAVITATIGNFMAYCIVTVEVDDTAVDEVESDAKKEDVIYDMQGYRLIEITKPGIYIINGKKVYVK